MLRVWHFLLPTFVNEPRIRGIVALQQLAKLFKIRQLLWDMYFAGAKEAHYIADGFVVPAKTGSMLSLSRGGEAINKEKSIMYLTVLGQNRHGVSWIFWRSCVTTLSGNDRRQSVQVRTTKGMPRESLPFRGIQTGADSLLWSVAWTTEVCIKSATI